MKGIGNERKDYVGMVEAMGEAIVNNADFIIPSEEVKWTNIVVSFSIDPLEVPKLNISIDSVPNEIINFFTRDVDIDYKM
jgi:hypothetical protein